MRSARRSARRSPLPRRILRPRSMSRTRAPRLRTRRPDPDHPGRAQRPACSTRGRGGRRRLGGRRGQERRTVRHCRRRPVRCRAGLPARPPGVSSRQGHAQTDTRVDVRGMLEKDCAEPGLGFLRPSHAELQPRNPQPDLDVGGTLGDDPLEDGKRFGGSSGPRQLFCEVPIGRRRLARHGQDERCGERNEHASQLSSANPEPRR